MKIYNRDIESHLKSAIKHFPAIVLSGPRRSGKTFLLKKLFPKASYYLLEDPDLLMRIKADPNSWLEAITTPAIIDEIQNIPELFNYIRTNIDYNPNSKGQWLLTGSQEFSLMAGVVESMAGRAAVFELLPFSFKEINYWDLNLGFFPELIVNPKISAIWFKSYIQTYLERDIRALKAIKDLSTFRRFLSLLATRHGQILNKSDLAAPLGISVPTITEWISILETTGIIVIIPPFFENFGKRLVKSSKIYWIDSGLICYLVGIESRHQLEKSPFLGAIFEGFIAAEIIKNQINQGKRKELYYFRDEQGLEVDFIRPNINGSLDLIEVKWSKTILPKMAASLINLQKNIKNHEVNCFLVHLKPQMRDKSNITVIAPRVKAVSVEDFFKA